MARYAIVQSGAVINIVESNNEVAAVNGWVPAASASIGDLYDGQVFTPVIQTVPVPESVTTFQAKAALLNAGLLNDFEALIAAPETSGILKLAWQYAPVFLRDSPAVLSLTALAGLTEIQVDELFISASKIAV